MALSERLPAIQSSLFLTSSVGNRGVSWLPRKERAVSARACTCRDARPLHRWTGPMPAQAAMRAGGLRAKGFRRLATRAFPSAIQCLGLRTDSWHKSACRECPAFTCRSGHAISRSAPFRHLALPPTGVCASMPLCDLTAARCSAFGRDGGGPQPHVSHSSINARGVLVPTPPPAQFFQT